MCLDFYAERILRKETTDIYQGTNAWNGYYWGVDYVVDPLEKILTIVSLNQLGKKLHMVN
ncbi:MAG: hypothetical protein CM15mP127_15070 [Gammaproteobacteria bacterium]|nr:MAG: hypothetical protein CM15mP127_15070 [Gammaproteobacteria bacterium]